MKVYLDDTNNTVNMGKLSLLPVLLGLWLGFMFLMILDKVIPHMHIDSGDIEGPSCNLKKSTMTALAVALHNLPEGIAVGVAFGSVMYNLDGATILSACLLTLGIGIQNFPEGTAVSVPLRRDGMSRRKSFFYGQLSGIVEPISGVLGALLVLKIRYLLPFLLSFAAGAMIYVVVEELIPESQTNENKDLMAFATLIGFSIMMSLDVLLG